MCSNNSLGASSLLFCSSTVSDMAPINESSKQTVKLIVSAVGYPNRIVSLGLEPASAA